MQVKQSAKALLADARNVALAKTLLRYGTAAYVMGVTNDLADARGTLLPDGYAPLPDLGFDYIPFMPGESFSSILLSPLSLSSAALFILSSSSLLLNYLFLFLLVDDVFCCYQKYMYIKIGLGWLADSLVKALYVLVFLRIFLSAHRRVLVCSFFCFSSFTRSSS